MHVAVVANPGLIAAGALGAAIFFVQNAWPAVGLRVKNLAIALFVCAATSVASLVIAPTWRIGVGWMVTALLLQWSHMVFRPAQLLWLRAGIVIALVVVSEVLLEI